MAYATTADVQDRTLRTYTEDEQAVINSLLEDAAVMIDACAAGASDGQKLVVSCRMVIRAIGADQEVGVPIGATQGSMTAGPYTQSWTVSSGGTTGELYLSKSDKALLGAANRIGAYNPLLGTVSADA